MLWKPSRSAHHIELKTDEDNAEEMEMIENSGEVSSSPSSSSGAAGHMRKASSHTASRAARSGSKGELMDPDVLRLRRRWITKEALAAASSAITGLLILVSALAGVGIHNSAILLAGTSLAVAGGISAGITRWRSAARDARVFVREKQTMEWNLQTFPDSALEEMADICMMRGMTDGEGQACADAMAKSKEVFVRFQLLEEKGVLEPEAPWAAWRTGLFALLAYAMAGVAFLLPYGVTFKLSWEYDLSGFSAVHIISCFIGFCMLTLFESWNAHFAKESKLARGLTMFFTAVLYSSVAYIMPWGMASAIGLEVDTSLGRTVRIVQQQQEGGGAGAGANWSNASSMGNSSHDHFTHPKL